VFNILRMIKIHDFFLDFAKTDFTCPHCQKMHHDKDDKYFDRINKNKTWTTKVNCDCGKLFYLTISFDGQFQTFKK
jgi:hypothetical protein